VIVIEKQGATQAVPDVKEQILPQPKGDALGWTADTAGLPDSIARHIGHFVDATSASIRAWKSETRTSSTVADYFSPQACTEEQLPDRPTPYDGEPVLLETRLAGSPWVDHGDDPDLPADVRRQMQTYGAQSILYIPLPVQFHVVGYVEIWESRHQREFTSEEKRVCQAIAQTAAVAIDNARLHDRLQEEMVERQRAEEALRQLGQDLEAQVAARTAELNGINAELVRKVAESKQAEDWLLQRNRELLSLQSAAAATTASLDLQFVLETVTWEMANLLGIEGCVIYEWIEGADTLSVIATYDATGSEDNRLIDQVCHLAHYPLRRRVLAERFAQQIAVSQPSADPAESKRMREAGIRTLLILPMVFQERVVGLAEMYDSQVERTLTDHEMSLAQFLATQAAGAVENARLYNRAQQEITERMRAEEQIKASLKEKEVLLKEIHHRVKNNLQVVSSLLNLQAHRIEDQAVLDVLRESQNRIRSMALIHERLYRSKDLAGIDFAVYIRELATHLVHSYRAHLGPVELKIEADDVLLGVDTAVPCGLITNELISNALKHAFPDGRAGEIRVTLKATADRQVTMAFSDDGIGFPDSVDFHNTESLGMQLVNTLVGQLDGTVELCRKAGTEFRITFVAP
jgi:two-component sensor histidine kinase